MIPFTRENEGRISQNLTRDALYNKLSSVQKGKETRLEKSNSMKFTLFVHAIVGIYNDKVREDGKDGARDIWLERGHNAASGLINLNYAS